MEMKKEMHVNDHHSVNAKIMKKVLPLYLP